MTAALLALVVLLGILAMVAPSTPAGAVTTSGVGNVVTGGANYGCAIRADRQLACWGQIGSVSSPTPTIYPGLAGVKEVAAANATVCALLTNNRVWCFGDGTQGQLGNNTLVSSNTPGQVSSLIDAVNITAGANHFCVARVNGSVRCWGSNSSGQLGNGSTLTTPSKVPVNISTANNNMQGTVQVSAGENHTCARRTNGLVSCWGSNASGQLGTGGTPASTSVPQTVPSLTNVTALASGKAFTCALTSTTGPQCWGSGAQGALGNGSTDGSTSPTAVSGGLSGLTSIGASATGACVATSAGGLSCWGTPAGDGTNDPALTPVAVSGAGIVAHLSAGALSAAPCAIDTTGRGACWGATPAVGDGSGTAQPSPVALPGGGSYSGGSVEPTAPVAPVWRSATANEASADLLWNPPVDDGGSPVTGYVITPYIGGTAQTPIQYNSTVPDTRVTGLTPGTTYTFTLRAVNAIGTSAESAPSAPVVPKTVRRDPSAPRNLVLTPSRDDLSVTATWDAPTDVGNPAFDSYTAHLTREDGVTQAKTLPVDAATVTFTGLVDDFAYTFTLQARAGQGASPQVTKRFLFCECIVGTVLDQTGAPLANVRVRAIAPDGKLGAEATTDENGKYQLRVPSSTTAYKVQFADKYAVPARFPLQYRMVDGDVDMLKAGNEPVEDRIVVQRAITGRVLDQSGNPLANVRVRAIDASTGKLGAESLSDATGAYTLKVPSPTTGYKIQFADKHDVPARFVMQYRMAGGSPAVVTAGGAPLEDRITVRGAITGVARDGSTNGVVSGLRVRALLDGKLVDETTTAADGTFTLDGLAPGVDYAVQIADKRPTPVYPLRWYVNSPTAAGATLVQPGAAITFLVYPA